MTKLKGLILMSIVVLVFSLSVLLDIVTSEQDSVVFHTSDGPKH